MKVVSAEFEKSAFKAQDWPCDGLPEIAFLGRSNVGKSSLINSLLQRRALARTSNTPGRTQSINFFRINEAFYFVDLPGYGFARVSKGMRGEWREMSEEYLLGRSELALCVQLVDARRPPSPLDLELNGWLLHNGRPQVTVATKTDKLSANELRGTLRAIREAMPRTPVIAYSARTGHGREALWIEIAAAVKKV